MTEQECKAAYDWVVNNPPSVDDYIQHAEKSAQDNPTKSILLLCRAIKRIARDSK